MPDQPGLQVSKDAPAKLKICKDNLKLLKTDPDKYNTSSSCMFVFEPPQFHIQNGIYDVHFQVLRDHQEDKFQWIRCNAWRALSDQSSTEAGSEGIANTGGPNKGIEYMVEQLLVNQPFSGMCADHLDIQQEILADLAGILMFDNNNTRGPAAMKAGLVPAIARSFKVEPDYRPTMNRACRVLAYILARNPEYAISFKDAGVLELVDKAIKVLEVPDKTPAFFGFTMDQVYSKDACTYPRLILLGDEVSQLKAEDELKAYISLEVGAKPWATIKVKDSFYTR